MSFVSRVRVFVLSFYFLKLEKDRKVLGGVCGRLKGLWSLLCGSDPCEKLFFASEAFRGASFEPGPDFVGFEPANFCRDRQIVITPNVDSP